MSSSRWSAEGGGATRNADSGGLCRGKERRIVNHPVGQSCAKHASGLWAAGEVPVVPSEQSAGPTTGRDAGVW